MEKEVDKNENQEKQEKKSIGSSLWEFVKIIVTACIVALLLNHFVLINAVIPSESMENLLQIDDRIFGNRLSYLFHGPERYDVVMFKYPVDGETIYIKRVIGLPGETVEIRDAKIYIDGAQEPIEENYLPEEWVARNDGYIFEVPEDSYLMLGDNRNWSEDARSWAECAIEAGVATTEEEALSYTYVHKDEIIGRAVMKYYPHFEMFLNI